MTPETASENSGRSAESPTAGIEALSPSNVPAGAADMPNNATASAEHAPTLRSTQRR